MDIISIVTSQEFVLGISGLLGGAWRAGSWYLNNKDEYEQTKVIKIIRNLGIGIFAGLNTVNINALAGEYLQVNIPVIAPIAFMYGMCAELMLMTIYNTIKNKVNALFTKYKTNK